MKLWTGADVVWTGPESTDGEHCLSRGDRAVVVDAGRHHVSSFGTLGDGRRPLPRNNVVIRVGGVADVEVDPRHLEIVAPDHALRPEANAGAASWWLDQLEPQGPALTVASFVPRSFESVARVLHPWSHGEGRSARWVDVAEEVGTGDLDELNSRYIDVMYSNVPSRSLDPFNGPDTGHLDGVTAEALVEVLADATGTSGDVYVAVWEGWGDTPPARFPGAARLPTPARGHFLLRGPLEGVLTPVSAATTGRRPASGIWWPADHSWFVHTEIDFPWTFVAGDRDLARTIHRHPALETQATRHEASANTLAG